MNSKDKKFLGIRDIAKLAGVSPSTVSRVINSPETISKKTCERVNAIIQQYGYIPNQFSKNLYTGTSNIIAIYIYDIQNPFYTRLIYELNTIALNNNYILIVCDIENQLERERKYYDFCKSARCAGIIYTSDFYNDYSFLENDYSQIPVVFIDCQHHKNHPCYTVKPDDDKALRLLTDYLHRLNHKKIGFVGAQSNALCTEERKAHFISNMNRLHLEVPEEYIFVGNSYVQSGMDGFDYFYTMSEKPTAVIAVNDQVAHSFAVRASDWKVSIPDDISLCGVDAIDRVFFSPSITSVKLDIRAMAQAAFDLILHSSKVPAPVSEICDVTLQIGQSCKKISYE